MQRGKLSQKAGGWIRAILTKGCARNEANASPKLVFLYVPFCRGASEREAVHRTKKRTTKLGLGSRGEDAMDVARLKTSSSSSSSVNAGSRPKRTIRRMYGECMANGWLLLLSATLPVAWSGQAVECHFVQGNAVEGRGSTA